MATRSNTGKPQSASRSKRSTTNLSNLRLAPLSEKFEPPKQQTHGRPSDSPAGSPYARYHSSYIYGQSAPTTPGILSRSSSRKNLSCGLSRRGSLYDDDETEYAYAALGPQSGGLKVDTQIPQSKSDAALMLQQRLAGHASRSPVRRRNVAKSRTGGTTTPRSQKRAAELDNEWLVRTGAATSAILQESKGQSWIASSTSLAVLDQEAEDDEGYEEMAAANARAETLRFVDDEGGSPVSAREGPKVSRWGSRYGSRQGSRRTSRRGSTVGLRTPMASSAGPRGYFEPVPLAGVQDGSDDDLEDGDDEDLAQFSESGSAGLGGIIDRLIGFNVFTLEEQGEESATDDKHGRESELLRAKRREADMRRRRQEKDQLLAARRTAKQDRGHAADQDEGGWQDAAWLLSIASKALFAE